MTTATTKRKGSGGILYTVFYLAGMLLLFVGERMVLERQGVRLSLDLVGAAGVLAAVVGRLVRRSKLQGAARSVELRLLACYLVGLLAVLVYLAQADFIMDRLRPHFGAPKTTERYQVVLATLWPTLWVCSLLPLIFMEISYAAMDVEKTIELRRVQRSAASGLTLAMTVCLVFAANYVLSEFNKKVDLSYFKTSQASESSRKMVKNLSEPFKVTLFFPGANEVQEQVEAYFNDLKRESSYVQMRVVDHAMEPELAKELGVSDNGIVVMSRRKQNEQINIGTKLDRAKANLKKLDGDFQAAFRKLSQVQKVAYLTVGHEERGQQERDKVAGSSIRDMRTLLQRMNYDVKELGIGQGLASEVPADATMVIIIGPRKEFLPAEIESLKKYLAGGGHAIVLLDPEAGLDMAPLLSPFGLKFVPVRLANDRFNVRLRDGSTEANRHAIYSNRFSAHASVTTLTRNSNQLATVMIGAGYLEEIPPTETPARKPQVQFTIHSMPMTWNDENANSELDAPKEARKVFELGAVVTRATGKPAPTGPGKKNEPPETRLIVVADSDVVSDLVFRNPGNAYLLIDAVKWLGGEEEYMGAVTSEEDVRIMHTREKDQWWFYLTIFAMPALVLAAGLVYVSRRRKKS